MATPWVVTQLPAVKFVPLCSAKSTPLKYHRWEPTETYLLVVVNMIWPNVSVFKSYTLFHVKCKDSTSWLLNWKFLKELLQKFHKIHCISLQQLFGSLFHFNVLLPSTLWLVYAFTNSFYLYNHLNFQQINQLFLL